MWCWGKMDGNKVKQRSVRVNKKEEKSCYAIWCQHKKLGHTLNTMRNSMHYPGKRGKGRPRTSYISQIIIKMQNMKNSVTINNLEKH